MAGKTKSNGGGSRTQASNAKATAAAAPTKRKAKAPGQPGRPTKRTDALVTRILTQLEAGVPVAVICRQPGMPHRSTLRDWLLADPDGLGARFDQARLDGEEVLAAECLEIADDGTNDYVMGKGGLVLNTEAVQRSKLRIWTRLTLLEKWNGKKWGPKVDHTHNGHVTLEQLVTGAGGPAK